MILIDLPAANWLLTSSEIFFKTSNTPFDSFAVKVLPLTACNVSPYWINGWPTGTLICFPLLNIKPVLDTWTNPSCVDITAWGTNVPAILFLSFVAFPNFYKNYKKEMINMMDEIVNKDY